MTSGESGTSARPDERVEIGRVAKAHGLRGEVAVHLDSDVPDRLSVGTPVWVAGRATTVATVRPHQGRSLIRFAHVTDRTAAELLRGAIVEAAPLDPEDLDVYLVTELVGRAVRTRDGVVLGTVTALVEMPPVAGYDLLEVTRADGTSWLLPAADELVEVVELGEGERELIVDELPDGLVEP
jgi:16S rRNA processing protein RimM